MENFTDRDLKYFSDKVTEGFNKVVPKNLRGKNINKTEEKSYNNWINRLRERLGWFKF